MIARDGEDNVARPSLAWLVFRGTAAVDGYLINGIQRREWNRDSPQPHVAP